MKKKNGFTLVELLAVISILAILLVIFAPSLIGNIGTRKEEALNRVYDLVKTAARNYVIDYDVELPSRVDINDLCGRYIDCPIINPVTNEELDGYIFANDDYIYMEISEVSFDIEFNGAEPNQTFQSKYEPGTIIELIEPIREGFEFKGWEVIKGNSVVKDNKLIIGYEDTIIYAKWETCLN